MQVRNVRLLAVFITEKKLYAIFASFFIYSASVESASWIGK